MPTGLLVTGPPAAHSQSSAIRLKRGPSWSTPSCEKKRSPTTSMLLSTSPMRRRAPSDRTTLPCGANACPTTSARAGRDEGARRIEAPGGVVAPVAIRVVDGLLLRRERRADGPQEVGGLAGEGEEPRTRTRLPEERGDRKDTGRDDLHGTASIRGRALTGMVTTEHPPRRAAGHREARRRPGRAAPGASGRAAPPSPHHRAPVHVRPQTFCSPPPKVRVTSSPDPAIQAAMRPGLGGRGGGRGPAV